MVCRLHHFAVMLLVPCAAMLLVSCGSGDGDGRAIAAAMPGGFVEQAGSAIRPRWSTDTLHELLPNGRGKFTFPSPYLTEAMRITAAEDCDGADCVRPIGYSYWRNLNNHVNSNEILIVLGLNQAHGGTGPTLFSYDKLTEEVTNRGPLFPPGHPLSGGTTTGWYFSATRPTTLYINDGSKMLRYDVVTHDSEAVFDAASQFGGNREIWQMSSSNDDLVHAATLRVKGTKNFLGCVVYVERPDNSCITRKPATSMSARSTKADAFSSSSSNSMAVVGWITVSSTCKRGVKSGYSICLVLAPLATTIPASAMWWAMTGTISCRMRR